MSILSVIAIVVLIVSVAAFIIQFMKGGSRSVWPLGLSGVLSVVCLGLVTHVTHGLDAHMAMRNGNDAVADVAGMADGSVDDDHDFDFVGNELDEDAPAEAAVVADSAAVAESGAAEAAVVADSAAVAESGAAEAAVVADSAAVAESGAAEAAVVADSAAAAESGVVEAAVVADSAAAAESGVVEAAVVADSPEDANDALAPFVVAGDRVDEAKINEVIHFDGKKSRKNTASLAAYHWDFGDGTSADGVSVNHAFKALGTYSVVLTVTDKAGHKGQGIRVVEVNRPDGKIRYITNRKVNDLVNMKRNVDDLTGTFTKAYAGSRTHIEAEASIEAAEGCTCSLVVSLSGPGCNVVQTKQLSDGGEGETTAKASCHGEMGEYTWTIKRQTSGSCACSFRKMTIDGFES